MGNKLEKRYGLFTAICMVVGIVIGSGVFYKASKVFAASENLGQALAIVGSVGLVMIICSLAFAILGTKYEKVSGVVDYAEVALGPKYGYYVGWFMNSMYYPVLASVLAWVAGRYMCDLFGLPTKGETTLAFGVFFLCAGYAVNGLAPKLAGKLQVSMTVIKLIPLCLMAVVGTIAGLANGMTVEAFTRTTAELGSGSTGSFSAGITGFAFAYEGWIIATTINAELKDAKKNLPIALIVGALICTGVYMLYFVGITGALDWESVIAYGEDVPRYAFSAMFGNVFGTIVYVFIIISCLGTMNGLILGGCRGMYSLAVREKGPARELFSEVSPSSNMAANSSLISLFFSGFWLMFWQVFFVEGFINGMLGIGWSPVANNIPIWINWEPDEISIICLYAMYIPMFVAIMVKQKELNSLQRFVIPGLAVGACLFMCYQCYVAYGVQCWYFLIFFALLMFAGYLFDRFGARALAKRQD